MSQQRLGRRDVLKSTAAGTVGALAFSSTTGARESPETQASDAGEKLWSFETDFGVMKSGPTIVDGTVYVGTRDGVLYVFDATTGEKQWEFLTEGIINPSPTVVDDTVYIASNDNSVYALDADPDWKEGSAEDGDYRWRFETDERDIHYEGINHIWGSPTVLDGTVYVGNNSGYVYAIDAETGEQEWRFDEPKDWITTSPTVVDGTVYIGAGWDETDKHLYAIDAETGEEEWRFQAEGDIASSATVADGTVYVGSYLTEQVDGEAAATSASPNIDPETGDLTEGVTTQQEWEYYGWLHAVDAEAGTEEWTVEADGWIRGSPTVADGTVYVGSNDGLLHALEAETGESEWTFATEGWIDESSPTVVNDTVFVADIGSEIGGSVYGIDTATGEKEWQFETEAAGFRSSPTVVDGVLYIGSDAGHGGEDSNMYAIDTHVDCSSNGSRVELGTHGHHHVWAEYAAEDREYEDEMWSFETDFGVMKSGPTIVDETVYVGTRDGVLYAFDATTGEKQWEFLSEGIINPSPTVVDDTVYIASNDNSVYALDVDPDWKEGSAEDGDYRWRFETDERDIHYEGINHIWGSPTVLDGTVYVGNNSGYVYAIDAETGEQEWRFDEPRDWITNAPTVVDGTVYIGTGWGGTDEHLYAIDAETGKEEWRFKAEADISSSATVANGTVYVGCGDIREVGSAVGTRSTGSTIDPETGQRTPLVSAADDDPQFEYYGWLHAIDAEDGSEQWTEELNGRTRGSPTAADGTVYIGSTGKITESPGPTLHAFDCDTGDREWAFETDGPIDESSPTVVGETVFVADNPFDHGGVVYGVDTMTGEEEWRFETEAAGFRSSPTVVDGVLYIGSDAGHGGEDSNLYAVDTHVDGSSDGSRVELGTHGHHHHWAEYAADDSEGDVSDYADDDGNVQTDGLRAAIDDWKEADINTDLLRDVIDAWRSS